MPPAKPNSAPRTPPGQKPLPEVVDPKWLLKALAICLVAALICVYGTLCALFYQGRWQLVLHPSHTVDRTPASAGLVYSDVHFDAAETGQPRLTAWWIAASPQAGFASRYADYTILYLHDGSGSLADTVPTLARLHSAGLNVFAIDYRGFGTSDASVHPTQERMSEDTTAALEYLTQTRHISPLKIIPYGTGLAASLAASLANSHTSLPAIILDNPNPDPASTAVAAYPSAIIPVRLLFRNQFEIAAPLATLATPKFLIAGGPNSASPAPDSNPLQILFRQAHSPSFAITLPPDGAEQAYQVALARFLDQYLVASRMPGNGTVDSDRHTKK